MARVGGKFREIWFMEMIFNMLSWREFELIHFPETKFTWKCQPYADAIKVTLVSDLTISVSSECPTLVDFPDNIERPCNVANTLYIGWGYVTLW